MIKMKDMIGVGLMGMFLQDGVEVTNFDIETETIYLSIPAQSYRYSDNNKITNALEYAKQIKKTLIELEVFSPNMNLKYIVRDIFWTKEMGERNYNENRYLLSSYL